MEQNHTNQTKKLTGTQENVIVGAVAVLLTALLLIFVGWPRIKYWFSTPIIWNDPDYITVKVVDKEETDNKIDLLIDAFNASSNQITSYKLDIVCGSAVYSLNGRYGWGDGHTFSESILVKKDGYNAAFFKALSGKDVNDIKLKVHVRSLYNKDEKIVKQSGLVKIIGLAVISVVSGLLVAKANINNQWLRLLLKLLCVPSLVVLFVLMVAVSSSGDSGSSVATGRSAADANARNRAAAEYKRQSGLKASAVMTGRPQNAARAQGQMDKAFADMIAANNSHAKAEYKKAAQHKASAEMRGNQHDAAVAQRQMDRYMADMLQGK